MTTYYSLRRTSTGFLLAKFLDDGITFDVDVVYELEAEGPIKSNPDPWSHLGQPGNWSCTCPSYKRPCKHVLEIAPRFVHEAKTDTDWFLCVDDSRFYRPIQDPLRLGDEHFTVETLDPQPSPATFNPTAEPIKIQSWRRF